MSLNETMNDHMDAVRSVTGANGLLSIAAATDALNQTGTFVDHGIVSSGSANDFTQPGIYSIQNNTGDLPDNAWGLLTVLGSKKDKGHYIQQIFVNSTQGSVYSRLGVRADTINITWRGWIKLGGVINLAISSFKRVVTPLMGGVAYVA